MGDNVRIPGRVSPFRLIVAALLAGGCGGTEFPVSPTPVASGDVTTVSGGTWSGSVIAADGSIAGFNMTLIARGLGLVVGAAAQQPPGTVEVTGNFTTTAGLEGSVVGMLQGTLQNGIFEGTLNTASPACTRAYAGPITESTVAWTPAGNVAPSCPLTFSVQLPRPRGPECQYVVSLTRQVFSGAGGSGELRIDTGPACAWAAESLDDWLRVADGTPRTGSGAVAFSADANDMDAREGRLRVAIANQAFRITQGPRCTFSVSPTVVSVPAAGGSATLAVTAPAGCEWSAESAASWIVLTPTAGTGTAAVTVTAQPTAVGAREGFVTVAGQTVRVSQGPGCTYVVSPTPFSLPGDDFDSTPGVPGTLSIATAPDCEWTATIDDTWMRFDGDGQQVTGRGSRTLGYRADDNPSFIEPRFTTISVTGDRAVTVRVEIEQQDASD